MEKIITYSLSGHFIQNVADMVEKEYLKPGRDISGLAFVFGGRRPSLFLKKELSRRVKKGFLSPAFFSIDEFMGYLVSAKEPYSSIADLDVCYLIYTLIKKSFPEILERRENFAAFLPWAREIVAFIEQLDLEEIDPDVLENIQLNAEIGYDVPENINTLLTRLVSLRDAYHRALKKDKRYPRGLVYRLAARTVQEVPCVEFERIFFCNFFYLHKTEERVMKFLLDSDKATLILQGGEEWPVLKELAKRIGYPLHSPGMPLTGAGNSEKESYQLFLASGFDTHSQVCLVRDIVQRLGQTDNTVVVLPDSDKIIPLLTEISSFAKDFNISLGYPLRRSALYALFEYIFKAQATRKDNEYYAKDYIRLLSHPLVKNLKLVDDNPAVTRILVHKIEEVLLGIEKTPLGGSLFVKLGDIEVSRDLYEFALQTMKRMDIRVTIDELKETVSRLHALLFSPWETVSTCVEFSRHLKELLDALMDKGFLSGYPLNLKIVERMFAVQEELERASFVKEKFVNEDIFKIFRNKLENEMFSFSGSPLKGLQILGVLETRALNFDTVIIMDVNENTLPSLKISEPLIPREVMLRLGLNHLEKEEEIQRYQFRRLLASAKRVHLVYEESAQKERSRFIEELLWDRQKRENRLEVLEIPRAVFNVQVLPGKKEMRKDQRHREFLMKMTYSPSSIDTYLECPLKFYYRYVLGLREKEDLLAEPEASDIGTFIHALLEEGFGIFKNKKPVVDRAFREYFFDLLEKNFSREFEEKRRADAFLLKKIIEFRMRRFLDAESRRTVVKILGLERELKGRIVLGETYSFKVKIDRIDLLEDRTVLVVDYKTGAAEAPRSMNNFEEGALCREYIGDIIRSFQLPLYLHFVEKEYPGNPTNACLYAIRDVDKNGGLLKLFKAKEEFAAKDTIMAAYMRALEFILKEICDPEVPFTADRDNPYTCEYCPYSRACG